MNDRIIRAIALVLVLLMMLGTAACGNAAQPDAGSETLVEAPVPAEEASAEESSGSLLGGWSRPDSPVITDELAAVFEMDSELKMATVKTEMTERAEIENPNNVKVVTDKNGYALYFSRSVMPKAARCISISAFMPTSGISCLAMRRWNPLRWSSRSLWSSCAHWKMATALRSSRQKRSLLVLILPKIWRRSTRYTNRKELEYESG